MSPSTPDLHTEGLTQTSAAISWDSRAGPGPMTAVLHLSGPVGVGHVACSLDGVCLT